MEFVSAPTRTTSMPTRANSTPTEIVEELIKLKSWLASPHDSIKSMGIAIEGVVILYKFMEVFLRSSVAQKAIASLRGEKCVDELLDGYVKLLDACDTVRDTILSIKKHAQDLHSAIRRGTKLAISCNIEAYIQFRKCMNKDAEKCLKALKNTEADNNLCYNDTSLSEDLDFLTVMEVLGDVRSVATAVLRSFLSFFSTRRSTAKLCKWSIVSKVQALKGKEADNELERVDASMYLLHKNIKTNKGISVEMVQTTQSRVEALEKSLEDLEDGTQYIFRRLIQNRVSLLNILSF